MKQFEVVFDKEGREGYELIFADNEGDARTKFIKNNPDKKIKRVTEVK